MTDLLLTAREMAHADARTIADGTPGMTLMERAGLGVAAAVQAERPAGTAVLVVCGPGNNGGDGFVAARVLAERGYRVAVASYRGREALTGDAAKAASAYSGELMSTADAEPGRFDVVVDALFGAGLARDLEGAARAAVERINASNRPVIAVDIPSGIDADTGQVRGAAVRAATTVTFAARKPGHLLLPGRVHCGAVVVADIGIPEAILRTVSGRTFANGPGLWLQALPRPDLDSHKYDRGHTLVASGGATRTGAARLAARAALRIGSGLVTVASPPEALGVNAAHLTAVMLRGCDGAEGLETILQDPRFNALVLGPALGVHAVTRAMVAVALQARRRLVLDADALTSFQGFSSEIAGRFAGPPVVLTPHEGEFARLLQGQPRILDAPSKLERARRAAAFTGAVVLLKGPDTVIAAADGRAAINENGTPYLATAGSGDVLAGMVAGLLAQGMPAFEAACAAVWLHGEVGARLGPGLIAEDLPEHLPTVLRSLAPVPGQD